MIEWEIMKWSIVVIVFIFFSGCTYHSYDKERYKSWYNKKESQSSKREGRTPHYIDSRDLF